MFQFVFEGALLQLKQKRPAFVPLLQLPPDITIRTPTEPKREPFQQILNPYLDTNIVIVFHSIIDILKEMGVTPSHKFIFDQQPLPYQTFGCWLLWGADRPQTPVLASIRKARGNVPVRVRGSIATVEVEKTSIRPRAARTARHNQTNA